MIGPGLRTSLIRETCSDGRKMSTAAKVMDVLERVAGTDQVRKNPDLALFDQDILDSFGMVELMVELSEAFGIEISPAEIEREQWSSPRKIIDYMAKRVGS